MATATLEQRRAELQTYFDRTAKDAWARLTSDAPLGRIRATVRAGRDRMRRHLLDMLPLDLRGRRLLDAGCGTGALAVEAARRGAQVTAIDLSPQLLALAQSRLPQDLHPGSVQFRSGDMFLKSLGDFDHVVAMDSLIHYRAADVVRELAGLASRTRYNLLFTFAPSSALLLAMHAVGRLFPRSDRAPAIEPVRESELRRRMAREPALAQWQPERSLCVSSGFYTSQAMELVRR
ncbi:MAG TPA: magnesium protoporphyrin IX methyltransferase [Steroidobacteraceae bacterium]|nr:magnesium protoporphyrin IX methyltransferase [Steroidobacteraceae bacterium]